MRSKTTSDSLVPLQKALAAQGIHAHPWALLDASGGDLSLRGLARSVERLGLEARLTQLGPTDLAFVALQSLVELEGGAVATVVAHHPEGTVIERADGERLDVGSRLRATMALSIHPSPPSGTRLLARLALRTKSEPRAGRAVALAVVLAVLLLALGLAMPMLTHAVLSSALPNRAHDTLLLLAGGIVLVGLQLAYLGWLRRRALRYLSSHLSERASVDLVAHMLRLPFGRLRALDVGTVQQTVAAATGVAEAIPTVAPRAFDALLGVGYLGYTLALDPVSGAMTAAAGLLVVLIGFGTGHRRLARKRELTTRAAAQEQALYEVVAGIETVKAEGAEGRVLMRWQERLLAEQSASLALRLQSSTTATILAAIQTLVFGAVLLFTAHRCLSGAASIADLVAAVQASSSFMASAQSIGQLPSLLANLRGDLERADAMLSTPAETTHGRSGAAAAGPDKPALVLRDVWFRYDDDAPWLLSGLNLTVRAGETVLLAWPSGAGKSTLLRILAGLLAPARGDVLVYGREASAARRLVTYIPQHASLFPGSIFENLRTLSQGARPERILAAAKSSGLHDLVASWGMGLETVVSVGGTNLSSGQRQLVLLTAAVATETPIVLLDEALAHMDLAMRAKLGSGTSSLFEGRTVIAVAHDASPRELGAARVVSLAELDHESGTRWRRLA